jgi:hypothetical protein
LPLSGLSLVLPLIRKIRSKARSLERLLVSVVVLLLLLSWAVVLLVLLPELPQVLVLLLEELSSLAWR